MLEVNNLTKNFGGFTALSDINLSVNPGERLGLIGPNGSGKTTLINCVSGTIQDYEGAVVFNGENLNGLVAHKRARKGKDDCVPGVTERYEYPNNSDLIVNTGKTSISESLNLILEFVDKTISCQIE